MKSINLWKFVFIFLVFAIVIFAWFTNQVTQGILQMKLPHTTSIAFFETKYLYFYLHIFTVVPVFLLSFDKKVAFYKTWKYLFPAIFFVGAFFIFWDVIFTYKGVWGFNDDYVSGLKIFHLPVEEWLFFVTVPFACVFIHECLVAYFPKNIIGEKGAIITAILAVLCLIIAVIHWANIYTFSATFLAGAILLYHRIFIKETYLNRFYITYLVSLIPFFMLNGVLTGGFTKAPVVMYNPEEFLGIRCYSIPLDDFIYCFVYLLAVVTLYQHFKDKEQPNSNRLISIKK